jgi:hypothetical protein
VKRNLCKGILKGIHTSRNIFDENAGHRTPRTMANSMMNVEQPKAQAFFWKSEHGEHILSMEQENVLISNLDLHAS